MDNRLNNVRHGMTAAALGTIAAFLLTACASDPPKGPPPPTPDQVRGHADRTFDKLKQEERERAAQPSTSP
jgi:hypothetical protein